MSDSPRSHFILMAAAVFAAACDELPERTDVVCSPSFYDVIESRVHVTDDEGHGPDLGSGEWKRAVEHKLGVRQGADFPAIDSDAWCQRVYELVRSR